MVKRMYSGSDGPAYKKSKSSTSSTVVKVPTYSRVPTENEMKAYVAKVLRTRGLNPEVKWRTSVLSGSAVNASGSVDCMCLVDQGPDDFQRIGDRIAIKQLEIRGYVSSGATFTYDQVSLAVWIDKQVNGAATPLATAVGSTTAAPFTYYSLGAPASAALVRNQDWKDRFTVKYHVQRHANQQFASGPYEVADIVIVINFKNPLIVEYSTPNANVAAVSSNGLFFGYGDISGGSTISYISQIAFIDV